MEKNRENNPWELSLAVWAITFAALSLTGSAVAEPAETVLYSFKGGSDGAGPIAGLIADKEGALYGTTQNGGTGNGGSGFGTVFKLTPPTKGQTAWTETVLYRFTGGSDGGDVFAGLIADKEGALYGTTQGLAPSYGTVFKLTPPAKGQTAWTETVLHGFTGGSDGAAPRAGLIFDKEGALYGTTIVGPVFKLTPPAEGQTAWTETVLSLTASEAALIFDKEGALYGTTSGGGTGNAGTVFKLTPPTKGQTAWTPTVLYNFCSQPGCSDGYEPRAAPIFEKEGALYGTTEFGGTGNHLCIDRKTVRSAIAKGLEPPKYKTRPPRARSDFGVFVFHPDDGLKIHGAEHEATRDNVILELGMFMGKLGKERSLIMKPSDADLRIPTDLLGINLALYEAASAKADNLRAELGRPCTDIQDAIRKEIKNREKASKEDSDRLHAKLNLLIGAALETVCRAMSMPVTPEQASLRVFIFRKEDDELVCRYFWDPNPSEENVGVTRFKINPETASRIIVVRCVLDKETRRSEADDDAVKDVADETASGVVESLPKGFPGVQGRIKPSLRYVLAAPIWNPDGSIWGVIDFDAANASGKKRLQSAPSNSVMVRLAAHVGAVLIGTCATGGDILGLHGWAQLPGDDVTRQIVKGGH